MSDSDKPKGRQPSVDEVMNQVLAAERDARLAVAECHDEAARIVAVAEARARTLAGRSEARIKSAHRIADRAIARALSELSRVSHPTEGEEGSTPAPGAVAEAVPRPLARAVRALAAEILGGTL